MFRLLFLMFSISCGSTVSHNKITNDTPAAAESDNITIIPDEESTVPEPEAVIDTENIDLKSILSDETNVDLAKSLFDEFKDKVLENIADEELQNVDYDLIFEKLLEEVQNIESTEFSDIIDDIDLIATKIMEEDPILSKPEYLDDFNDKKIQFKLIVKLLGPKILSEGLGSINLDGLLTSMNNTVNQSS